MQVVSTHEIVGYKIIKVKGMVFGNVVRTRGVKGRILSIVDSILGGRAEAYRAELDKAKDDAMADAIKKAEALGANAIIGADFDMGEVLEGFIQASINGTAVVIEEVI